MTEMTEFIPQEIYAANDGRGDYEWNELHVYRSPARRDRFVIVTDSGCSCYGYGENIDLTERGLRALEPKGLNQVRIELAAWLGGERYTPDSIAREIERATIAMREARSERR